MKYMVSYCSERGKGKQACEDSALIGHLVIHDEAGTAELQRPCWICICDGVGGNAGGQEASLFVARELSECSAPESAADVKCLFIEINNRLLELAQKDLRSQTDGDDGNSAVSFRKSRISGPCRRHKALRKRRPVRSATDGRSNRISMVCGSSSPNIRQ